MEKLRNIKPSKDERLSNAPPNLFMPKAENLITMKKERENPDKAAAPIMLTEPGIENQHELWFKQDDTFE